MNKFNKLQIKSNFNRAAAKYQKEARLQKIVARRLIELNFENISKAENILDLGSGPGIVSDIIFEKEIFQNKKIFQVDLAYEMLKEASKQKNIFNINADIDFLPFKKKQFDLIISSLSLQWLDNLEYILKKIPLLLKERGLLCLAIITDGSLKELKISKEDCGIDLAINNFVTIEHLYKILSDDNFEIKTETIILDYKDLYDLLKSIKAIGAGYSNKTKKQLNKNSFKKLNDFYLQNFKLNSKVRGSWHICYLQVKK